MSKRNKSTQPVEEQKDSTPSEETFDAEGSIMATEAKIGLAIIGVLLISFGVVLFARFNKPADEAISDSSAKKSDEQMVRKTFVPPEETNSDASTKPAIAPALLPSGQSDIQVVSAEVDGVWSMVGDLDDGAGDLDDGAMAEESADEALSATPTKIPQPVLIPPEERALSNPTIEVNRVPAHEASSAVGEQTVSNPADRPPYPTVHVPTADASGPNAMPSPVRNPPVAANFDVRPTSNDVIPPSRIPSSDPEPTLPSSPLPATPVGEFGYSPIPGDVRERATSPVASTSLPDKGVYSIQANDNYWVISKKLYGTGAYFQALAEYNRKNHPDPSQLRLGQKILAPSSEELEKDYPDFCPRPDHRRAAARHVSMVGTQGLSPGRTYVVQEGDSLYDIAKHELGKVARVAELIELNRKALGTDYEYLTPGMKLVLPAEEPTARVTRTPGTTSRR